jgi:ATP phosphoribosyltransferase regulatory subunit
VERCSDSLEAARAGRIWIVLSSVGALETALSRLLTDSDTCALAQAFRERRLQVVADATRDLSPESRDQIRRLLEGGIAADDPILASLGPAGDVLAAVARALSLRKGCDVTIDLAEPPSRSYYTGFFFSVFGQGGGEPMAGGGRYDKLYAAFGKPRPAVGFSLGLEALVRP